MSEGVTIRRMAPDDMLRIVRQPSQIMQLGVVDDVTAEQAAIIAAQPHSHTVMDGRRVAAVFGITESYPGQQGVAWAIFASDLRRVHVALTRFCRSYIAHVGLSRIEAVAVCDPDAEGLPLRDALDLAMARPTPEMRWAMLLGLEPVHVLRRFGAAGETLVLCERIAP